jgi:hypothetical protein
MAAVQPPKQIQRHPRGVSAAGAQPVSVVVATMDRGPSLLNALDRLARLPEAPPIIAARGGVTPYPPGFLFD